MGSARVPRYRSAIRCCALLCLVLCASAVPSLAEEEETAWAPPAPEAEALEWIKLTSGEWLRGELKSMRDELLEFDSKELDLLKLDWEDIAEIRSPRYRQYVFSHGRTVTGPAVMKEGVIKVRVGEGVQEFQAAQIVSIVAGARRELDHWSMKANVSFETVSGNVNRKDFSAMGLIRREGWRSRFDTRYEGNLGELDGEETENKHLLSSRVDAYLTQRLFVSPLSVELLTDGFQNVDLRTTLAAGLGYDILRGGVDWNLQLDVGYLSTTYESVEEGESGLQESGTLAPTSLFEWDPTRDIDTSLMYKVTISVPEVKNTFHHLVATVEVDVYKALDVTLSFTWDRAENPEPREDGSVPMRDDSTLTFGLGIDL